MEKAEFEYLGPYHVEGIIGRGGMGAVYKGRHAKSGQVVAIKVIAPAVSNEMRFRRRFMAEAETLQRLKHPNIVEIIGIGEQEGYLFYSMEYVDGLSLQDYLRQRRVMPWPEVVQAGIEIAGALKQAHDMGIIHRDLKPANLMMTKKGVIKLTDFGIAKLFGAADVTAMGSVIGTADYMPPEQAEGKGVTTRSDLYSLGSVLFALLVGRAPFAGKTVPEVLYAVRYTPPPESAALVPDAPEQLHSLIAELLEKDPQKRPPTALVIGNRLKAIQQGMAKLSANGKTSLPTSRLAEPVPTNQPEIGKELTSIDLSDAADEDLRVTGHAEDTRERPTVIAPQSLIEKGPPPKRSNDASPTQKPSLVSGLDQTIDSIDPRDRNKTEYSDDEGSAIRGATHYTPVSEKKVKTYALSDDDESQSKFDWVHYGSIAGMVVLLVGAIVTGYFMLQPAGADLLYAQVASAIDSGNEDQLLEVQPAITEFIERFPNDPRAAELKEIAEESELMRWTRILTRRVARGGDEKLSAIEQAFLDAMKSRGQSVEHARLKLDAFLQVFGSVDNLPRNEARYVDLARFAAERLKFPAPTTTTEAETQLETLIRSAEGRLKGERLEQFYDSLLVLYAEKPWAQAQMSRIKTIRQKP